MTHPSHRLAPFSDDHHARATLFRALHDRDTQKNGVFIMPCAWDAASATIFEEAGFQSIGTTSGGVNWSLAEPDYVYRASRDDMLQAYGRIAKATSLPVSGDLENGYGDTPEQVAQTILDSIQLGMVGGSIEDQKMQANGALFDSQLAVERIQAARQAADETGLTYTLTARCEGYRPDDPQSYHLVVERLNRYREAGADCLFAPGISDINTLRNLVDDVCGPISFGMGATEKPLSQDMIEQCGVTRISTGGGIARAAFSAIRAAALEIKTTGRFGYLDQAISDSDINHYFNTHGQIDRRA